MYAHAAQNTCNIFSPSQHHDKLYQWVSICSCVWESICDQNSSESPYPVWEGKGRRLRKSVTVTALYLNFHLYLWTLELYNCYEVQPFWAASDSVKSIKKILQIWYFVIDFVLIWYLTVSKTWPRNRVAPISGIKGSKGSDSGGRGNLLHLTTQLFTPTPLFPSFYFVKIFLETGGQGDFFVLKRW